MQIKGLDQLRLHVPDLRSPVRCLLIGLIPLISFTAGILFLYGADTRWVDYSIDGSIDVALIGFLLIVQFFWQKKRLQSHLVFILTLLLPAQVYRMNVEEKLLTEQFCDEYRTYAQETKRLIQGVW